MPRLVAVPTAPGEPSVRIGSRHFDAQDWSPGATPPRSEAAGPTRKTASTFRPCSPQRPSPQSWSRPHDFLSDDVAPSPEFPAAPLSMLPGAVRQAHERHLAALRARARREPAIQRWLATGERLMAAAEPIVLGTPEDLGLPASVLHLGLWPAHVLLDGDSLTGLLGWERVAAGSPLLDIAQATLRLQGWSDEAVEVALGAYAEARSLSPEERRLLPAVAALDAVATTGRLLEQTYAVDETARPPRRIARGDRYDAALDDGARSKLRSHSRPWARASARPWRRGPRPTPMRVQEGGNPRARRR